MPSERRSIHSNQGGSSNTTHHSGRLSDNQWLADEVYPAIGTSSTSYSRSQSRSRKSSSQDSNDTHSARASLEVPGTTMRARDMPSESIAFTEDYKPTSNDDKRDRSKSRSRISSESSTPRSRSRSAYDTPHEPAAEKLWANDKERKHGKFLEKFLTHKLSPSFLK